MNASLFINGTVPIQSANMIFLVPALFLVLFAMGMGVWRLSSEGPKAAMISVVRVLVYGGFALFVLFCGVLAFHYATGGH